MPFAKNTIIGLTAFSLIAPSAKGATLCEELRTIVDGANNGFVALRSPVGKKHDLDSGSFSSYEMTSPPPGADHCVILISSRATLRCTWAYDDEEATIRNYSFFVTGFSSCFPNAKATKITKGSPQKELTTWKLTEEVVDEEDRGISIGVDYNIRTDKTGTVSFSVRHY